MRKFIDILDEMIIRYQPNNVVSGTVVLAHRESIWILDPNEDEIEALEDIEERTGIEASIVYDLLSSDIERPDILAGEIRNNYLYVTDKFGQNPITSLLIKKVVNQLKLDGVKVSTLDDEGEEEININRLQLLGKIPEIVFHGTSSKYIPQILKTGLVPTSPNRNWPKYQFNRVFMTASYTEAVFHANRTSSLKHSSFPIVISTRIPDRTKIGFDFDVADRFVGDLSAIERHGYSAALSKRGTSTDDIRKIHPKLDVTREAGTFSYDGRVPATSFVSFTIPQEMDKKLSVAGRDSFTIDDPKELLRAIEMMEIYGFYDPDFEPGDEDL